MPSTNTGGGWKCGQEIVSRLPLSSEVVNTRQDQLQAVDGRSSNLIDLRLRQLPLLTSPHHRHLPTAQFLPIILFCLSLCSICSQHEHQCSKVACHCPKIPETSFGARLLRRRFQARRYGLRKSPSRPRSPRGQLTMGNITETESRLWPAAE